MSKNKPYMNKYISHLYLYIILLCPVFYSLLSSLFFLLSSLFFLLSPFFFLLYSFLSLLSSFFSLLSSFFFFLYYVSSLLLSFFFLLFSFFLLSYLLCSRCGCFWRVSWFVFSAFPLPANPRPHANFRMPIFAKIIKIEVPRPRDYAHRVERKQFCFETGLKIAVGVLKVGFVKKQGFG